MIALDWLSASEVCCAKSPISEATTAKPLPASPALAASIEAFKESSPVCFEIFAMSWLIEVISSMPA